MEGNHYKRSTCRLCDGNDTQLVVPITATPVGDAFVKKEALEVEQECYPLDLYLCNSCGHVQCLDVVNPEILFGHYTYLSGNSAGIVKHMAEYAAEVIEAHNLQENDFVVEVGSNDGTLLANFQAAGMKTLGVDPASNIAKLASDKGIETIADFFTRDLAQSIREERGAASVVIANNVFAHADDLRGIAEGICDLLAEDGVFVFEISYLKDIIDKMLLGTIFHEHVSHHSVKPMKRFLESCGMELIDIKHVSIQGGSLICTAQRKGGPKAEKPVVQEYLRMEAELGLDQPALFEDFTRRLDTLREEVKNELLELHNSGKKIAGFGAARGGTLLVYHFGLGELLDFIVDDNPEKHETFSPGYHIPVYPTSVMYEEKPDIVFILAWIHSKPIIKNHQKYVDEGGTFITCYPHMMTVTKDRPFQG